MTDFRDEVAALVPRLRAFARGLTGGDRQLADDLVQDTVVLAFRAEDRFVPGTNLGAWLYTILRNRFRTVLARRRGRAEVPADEELEAVWWTPAAQEAVIEVGAFRRAFRRLPPHHREVLVLVAVEGLSYERVAGLCGCEIGTVKSRVNRARTELRRMLLDDPPAAGRRRGRAPPAQPKAPGSSLSNCARTMA